MLTIRTLTNLTARDGRRLRSGGFEIEYIETKHLPDGDQSRIVWSRPYYPGEIRMGELRYYVAPATSRKWPGYRK